MSLALEFQSYVAFLDRYKGTTGARLDFQPDQSRLKPHIFLQRISEYVENRMSGLRHPTRIPSIEFKRNEIGTSSLLRGENTIFIIDHIYAANYPVVYALLCRLHAQNVLNYNRIDWSDQRAFQRLVDTAVFVFGLGKQFLSGASYTMSGTGGNLHGALTKSEYAVLEEIVRNSM